MNNTSEEINVTSGMEATHKPSVADALFDREVRLIVLYLEVIIGTIGGVCVCLWLWSNKWRKSRVNKLILHVAISDLLVVFLACLPQLIWEYDRHWKAGEAFCKILRYTTSFAMMASNYMLVVLSIDRHEAIMHPLKDPIAIWKLTGLGWGAAALLSVPQLVVFHTNYVTEEGPFQNMTVCESIFRMRDIFHRQAYLTFISLVVFYIPLVIITVCYIRIFVQIRRRASEGRNPSGKAGHTPKSGKIQLQSSQCSSFNKAKIKILKMTVVVVATFAICNFPYHLLEIIYNFGDHTKVNPQLAAILGGMAVANSSVNPFVFLAFNATKTCISGLFPWVKIPREPSVYDSNVSTRSEYVGGHSNAATAMTDIGRVGPTGGNIYTSRKIAAAAAANKRGTYCRVDSEDLTERPSVILNDNNRAQVSFSLKDNKYDY